MHNAAHNGRTVYQGMKARYRHPWLILPASHIQTDRPDQWVHILSCPRETYV